MSSWTSLGVIIGPQGETELIVWDGSGVGGEAARIGGEAVGIRGEAVGIRGEAVGIGWGAAGIGWEAVGIGIGNRIEGQTEEARQERFRMTN